MYIAQRPSRSNSVAIRQQQVHVRLWGERASEQPPLVLLRRGLSLMRAEPEVVARASKRGARPATAREVEAALAR